MSLQELFRSTDLLAQFEEAARAHGYTNFNKRGVFYCHSELNTFAQGWVSGQRSKQAA